MKAKAVLLTVLAMSTAVMLAAGPAWAKEGGKVSEPEAAQIGVEAYIYGYPLVTMELTWGASSPRCPASLWGS